MLCFSPDNVKVYIRETCKFYENTTSTNKTIAVRIAKCHFVSEQQLVSQLQEISTVLIIIKKHNMLMLVTPIQTALFEMSTG